MTEPQARERSKAKMQQIQELATSLKVTISAAQVIKNNMIQTIVIWSDDEDYQIDPPAPIITRGPEEQKESV